MLILATSAADVGVELTEWLWLADGWTRAIVAAASKRACANADAMTNATLCTRVPMTWLRYRVNITVVVRTAESEHSLCSVTGQLGKCKSSSPCTSCSSFASDTYLFLQLLASTLVRRAYTC